ncbi:MAG: DsbE family thiol:disulfide interchange protein [Rhodospirillales bacterium]|nr:DsbE family thiol:disulfide interchange protein [Rhodospirillales bacterium]
MSNKRLLFIIPLLVFMILVGYFAVGLTKDPSRLPNMLAGKPVPEFTLAPLLGRDDKGFSRTDLLDDVTLVNVFGSWCVACRVEHPFLMALRENNQIPIHAIDWREEDPQAGPQWLKRFGDPYTLVGDDPKSKAAISFGVTGAPETFLVDKKGVVRFKHIGPLNDQVWQSTLLPLVQQLRKESTP